jgi:Cu-processing system permease protein
MLFKISKYVIYDIAKNKIILAYTLFLLVISVSLFKMDANTSKGTLSLLNIILIVVPLISVIFSTIHFYNSYEFTELLVAQPLPRKKILLSQFIGLSVSLAGAFYIGVGIPILIFSPDATGFTLVASGMVLSLIFVALAFLASVITKDKAKGIGIALMLWFYFVLIYDGMVLFVLFTFADYPLEKAMMGMVFLNPVDLARILVLLKLDVSALMGYSGAIFQDFLGSFKGSLLAGTFLVIWIMVPIFFAVRVFQKKDL